MIFRALESPIPRSAGQAAWQVFLETQKNTLPPCAIVFQFDHARLAGDLARAFTPEAFGEMPDEVIQAIAEHDFGWQEFDAMQLRRRDETEPRPFLRLNVEETQPAWDACIRHAQGWSPLFDVLVSRHFTLLAAANPDGREEFIRSETARRRTVERELPYSPEELDCWTGAIGFCDLLSLYLCCGATEPVEFALAHPADPRSSDARKVQLLWERNTLRFSAPILRPGTDVEVSAQSDAGGGSETTPLHLSWQFA